jgi:hypothetical protein
MSAADIELWLYACLDKSLSISQRHAEVMDRMSRVAAPLGFSVNGAKRSERADFVEQSDRKSLCRS